MNNKNKKTITFITYTIFLLWFTYLWWFYKKAKQAFENVKIDIEILSKAMFGHLKIARYGAPDNEFQNKFFYLRTHIGQLVHTEFRQIYQEFNFIRLLRIFAPNSDYDKERLFRLHLNSLEILKNLINECTELQKAVDSNFSEVSEHLSKICLIGETIISDSKLKFNEAIELINRMNALKLEPSSDEKYERLFSLQEKISKKLDSFDVVSQYQSWIYFFKESSIVFDRIEKIVLKNNDLNE